MELEPEGVAGVDEEGLAAPLVLGGPLAEALAVSSHTPFGSTRASPRASRSQSTRPPASCWTDDTRACFTSRKFP